MNLIQLSTALTVTGAIGAASFAAICAAKESSGAVAKFLYPISRQSDTEFRNGIPENFVSPNCGVRILQSYRTDVSTPRKLLNCSMLMLAGAVASAVTGGAILSVVGVALRLGALETVIKTSLVGFGVFGAFIGSLHDPKVGASAWY